MEAAENPNLDLVKTASNIIEPDILKKESRSEIRETSSEPSSTKTDTEKEEVKQEKKNDEQPQTVFGDEEPEYPTKKKLIPIITSLYLAFFLVALDRTILATAIPRITDEFHSLGDIGWYGSVYMLTTCGFQLFFGRLYTFYNPKNVFLAAIFIFEVGSAICGAAPNSIVFIVGRAIAGLGGSGCFSGAIVIIVYTVPLHQRPILQGMMGSIFGVASVAGPLLGGVFTTKVTWRWCFYINLPIGGFAMVVMFLLLKMPTPKNANTPIRQQIKQLDPIGTSLFLPAIICLVLALQWGGTTYAWSNARIIVLIIIFVLLIIGFIGVQFWKKELGTVPPRIAKQRSVAAGMWLQFCSGGSFMVVVYFIPIWFQAIKDVSAVKSGIMNLPLILSLVVASISAGIAVNRIGYYTPFIYASVMIMSIGAGLLTTFTPFTNHEKWIGYQVIYGFGLGMGMQQATLAAQACLPPKDSATGISLIMFTMQMGGAIFVSVAQNVFTNELAKGVTGIAGLDPKTVVNTGATELRKNVPVQFIPDVLLGYNRALVRCFDVALALAIAAVFGAVFIEWKSVKKDKPKKAKKGEEDVEKGAQKEVETKEAEEDLTAAKIAAASSD